MIPKIIWMVWCDFDNKLDGVLNETLEFYKNQVIKIHNKRDWECNIITKWSDLVQLLYDDKNVLDIIQNKYINAPNKSDVVRFYLLNKYGGFWIDFSTFLLTSLDVYYKYDANFICIYTPSVFIEQWIIKPFSFAFHNFNFKKNSRLTKIQNKFIKRKGIYKNYPFLTESFFIGSVPNHYITNNTFKQLTNFWKYALPKITDKDTLCFELNKYNHVLMSDIFDMNFVNTVIYNKFKDENSDKEKKQLLDDMYASCGYYVVYLQIYKALVEYISKTKIKIIQPTNKSKTFSKEIKDYDDICFTKDGIDSCKNVIISTKTDKILLVSAMHDRTIKWSDIPENRTSLENTYLEKKINSYKDVNKFIDKMVNNNIYQIKFSSWTRNSKIIPLLMQKTNKNKTNKNKTNKNKTNQNKTNKNKTNKNNLIFL